MSTQKNFANNVICPKWDTTIGTPVWDYDNPLLQKQIDGHDCRITDEARHIGLTKCYDAYVNGAHIGYGFSVDSAKILCELHLKHKLRK